jgi:hypothetical protein
MVRRNSFSILLELSLTLLAACGQAVTSLPTPPTPPPDKQAPTPPTETHLGTLLPHALAYFTFNVNGPGLVSLRAGSQGSVPSVPPPPPVLFLTIRAGQCPDKCGQVIAESNNGGLQFQATAGTYSVIVGNPNDETVTFNLVMDYPK